LSAGREGEERPSHDPVKQVGLPRLDRDQPAQRVEKVQDERARQVASFAAPEKPGDEMRN
jgi:hypothetical protein